MGLGRLHDALADHRNTAIIPASRVWSPPTPQVASLVGVAAASGSAGAPDPGETAGRTSSFPERGPVGPCAAGCIAGPSPSKRHLPIMTISFPRARAGWLQGKDSYLRPWAYEPFFGITQRASGLPPTFRISSLR